MSNKTENYTVVHHNDLNQLSLGDLNKAELDVLAVVLWRMKEKNTETIIFDKNELKELANVKYADGAEFQKIIRGISRKLLLLTFEIKTPGIVFDMFTMFNRFTLTEDGDLTVKVNEEFAYILTGFLEGNKGNFTKYVLKEYISLKSVYSKELYKHLQSMKGLGRKLFKVEEFDELMKPPKSYDRNLIHDRILKKALTELKTLPDFKDLDVEIIRSNKRGKPVIEYKFTWTPFKLNNKITKVTTNDVENADIKSVDGVPVPQEPTPVSIGNDSQKLSWEDKLEIKKEYRSAPRKWKSICKKWDVAGNKELKIIVEFVENKLETEM